jgi:hypothetical protein
LIFILARFAPSGVDPLSRSGQASLESTMATLRKQLRRIAQERFMSITTAAGALAFLTKGRKSRIVPAASRSQKRDLGVRTQA